MKKYKELVMQLNELIIQNQKLEEYYSRASKEVQFFDIKTVLGYLIEKIDLHNQELQGELSELLKKTEYELTFDIPVNGQTKLNETVKGQSEINILDHIRKQQITAWNAYNKTLALEYMPETVRNLFMLHRASIDETIRKIAELREHHMKLSVAM